MGNKKEKVGPLIILHGWAYDTKKWEPFSGLLEEDGIEHKILKIPGLTAPLASVWTLDDYVAWLDGETANSKKPIAILGHSNGGRIAAAFTARFPEKVSHLILIDSAGIIRRDIKTLTKKVVFGIIAKIGKKIVNRDLLKNLFYKVAQEEDYNRADPILKKTMLNLISENLEPTFAKINTPTVIIWGDEDKTTPLSDGQKIHQLIKRSTLEIIKDARHSPQFTHSMEVSKMILKFINS